MKRTPLKRRGKKTKEWDRIRRVLKGRFEDAGLTFCEFGYPQCMNDDGLTFCHYDKRRFLSPDELWIVALGCIRCHNRIEILKRENMKIEVLAAIGRRRLLGNYTGVNRWRMVHLNDQK